MIWKPDQPGFVGSATGNAFIVKNLFELKNAQRVLFEGNVLENVWGAFSQSGFAVLLTPANQDNAIRSLPHASQKVLARTSTVVRSDAGTLFEREHSSSGDRASSSAASVR
jgi:hypothetical protein